MSAEPSPVLPERAAPGLHAATVAVIDRVARPGRAIDLGAGSGALGDRLVALGFDVVAVDHDAAGFGGGARFVRADVEQDSLVELGQFDLVVAVEVIEHLESPAAFLRTIASLLDTEGVAIVTTPNVDSLPARIKFLVRGRIRMFDDTDDATHLSPMFERLFVGRLVPRAGLRVVEHVRHPDAGFVVGRPLFRALLRPIGRLLRSKGSLIGDNHVFVLKHDR